MHHSQYISLTVDRVAASRFSYEDILEFIRTH